VREWNRLVGLGASGGAPFLFSKSQNSFSEKHAKSNFATQIGSPLHALAWGGKSRQRRVLYRM
jgi:hypothetical protein